MKDPNQTKQTPDINIHRFLFQCIPVFDDLTHFYEEQFHTAVLWEYAMPLSSAQNILSDAQGSCV